MSRFIPKLLSGLLFLLFLVGCQSATPNEGGAVDSGAENTVIPATTPTITATTESVTNKIEPQNINFLGASFTFDPAMIGEVLPELVAAQAAEPGPGTPWAPPEHIAFTLVDTVGSQNHAPMGQYLSAEAQIHVYPVAGLNTEVQPVVAALQQLLAEQPDAAAVTVIRPGQDTFQPALTMLPPSNAVQTFRAQVAYVNFVGGRGIRYLTQLSQGPVPVSNQELFYTFQGLTDDGAVYVAAYFPVALAALPATSEMSDEALTALLEDWQGYLTQTTELLNGQVADAFTPDLAALDALLSSLSVAGVTPLPEVEGVWPDNNESVDNQPILQWAAYPDAIRYELVVVDDDAYPPVVAFSQFTTETMAQISPVLEPGSYSWTVRALDGSDVVLAELNRQFWVKAALGVVSPAFGDTVSATPTLSWEAYPDVISYQIIILDDDVYPPVVMVDQKTADTTFIVTTSLEPGSYSWTVWAMDANNKVVAELNGSFLISDET